MGLGRPGSSRAEVGPGVGPGKGVWAAGRGRGGFRARGAGRRPLTRGRGPFTVSVVVVIPGVPIIIAVLKWEQAALGLRAGGGGRAGALEGSGGAGVREARRLAAGQECGARRGGVASGGGEAGLGGGGAAAVSAAAAALGLKEQCETLPEMLISVPHFIIPWQGGSCECVCVSVSEKVRKRERVCVCGWCYHMDSVPSQRGIVLLDLVSLPFWGES